MLTLSPYSEYVPNIGIMILMTMTSQCSMRTWRSSDLSKRPASVFADAEKQAIKVTRRDGEPLVLMSQREADDRAQLFKLVAQLFSVLLEEEGSCVERMVELFPWMLALSQEDQQSCARDVIDATRVSLSTNQPQLVMSELRSWEETAAAIAAGLGNIDSGWFDEGKIVERP